ncbi:MAG TPA: hypothetical protein VF084_10030 [Nitrososphaeraceae archaeon]|jgi:hypothetical protein
MSESEENSNQNNSEELESAQENPKEIGSAESDPSTTEPAGELREKAAENTGEDDSKAPA